MRCCYKAVCSVCFSPTNTHSITRAFDPCNIVSCMRARESRLNAIYKTYLPFSQEQSKYFQNWCIEIKLFPRRIERRFSFTQFLRILVNCYIETFEGVAVAPWCWRQPHNLSIPNRFWIKQLSAESRSFSSIYGSHSHSLGCHWWSYPHYRHQHGCQGDGSDCDMSLSVFATFSKSSLCVVWVSLARNIFSSMFDVVSLWA